jgi:hypothetical protein
MTTAADIRNLVESRIERDPIPGLILEYLRAHDGKTLTQRDVPKINALVRERGVKLTFAIYIQKIAGMTNLKWADGSLLIAHTEAAPVIDAAQIEEHNRGYFSARAERNQRRAEVLASDLPVQAAALINKINEASEALTALIEYGAPLGDDRYAIEKLIPSWR